MTQPPNNPNTPLLLPPPPPPTPNERLARHLRSMFLTGLILVIPLAVSVYILSILYSVATAFIRPVAHFLIGALANAILPPATDKAAFEASVTTIQNVTTPILALILFALVVYILGILSTFVVGKRLIAAFENFIANLPLIKGIYGTTKQVIAVFRHNSGGSGFQRVVLVEFPRAGIWTIGFVTKTLTDASTATPYACVFIPMTPNPTSGFFQLFPLDQVRDTGWTVDQGIKIILSGGLLAPDHLPFSPPVSSPPEDPLQTP